VEPLYKTIVAVAVATALGWAVLILRPKRQWTNRDAEWLYTWAFALLVGLDLWTKWPSHVLGEMMTTNLAAMGPKWARAVGEWLCQR
jgi:hypothetical protein